LAVLLSAIVVETDAGLFLGLLLLNSDEGVQAHTKMKAKTNTKEPVFCFTAAKLHQNSRILPRLR